VIFFSAGMFSSPPPLFAAVAALKADGVAEAGNGLMWGGLGCVCGALPSEEAFLFNKVSSYS
jgi:hypothetical protein